MSVYSTLIDLWNAVTTSNGADSIRVNVVAGGGGGGGGTVQIEDSAGNPLTSTSGALNVDIQNTFFTLPYDAITVTYPSATQEVYASHTGGTGGTVQQTLTVNYSDASKASLTDASVV